MQEPVLKTVTKEEVKEHMHSGTAIVVNVLGPDSYRDHHIQGSISIPLKDLTEGGYSNIDRSRKVITYCASYTCNASRKAASFLAEKGFDSYAYEGGIKEWEESGLPVGRGST
ncbi:MAG: rhodanese-like domain-containing protein [Candidatus Thermoplasmatota archaeon]|jgi:rhodanese-related sulfurtransferase|nr:rhodanese-like domain-containing protein [Candidatus Thermoplasmatota archaeon]MCL5785051.1 rhodanese-like domain-containing protein [Candidatus Thermoplasmatota archaeon]